MGLLLVAPPQLHTSTNSNPTDLRTIQHIDISIRLGEQDLKFSLNKNMFCQNFWVLAVLHRGGEGGDSVYFVSDGDNTVNDNTVDNTV